MVEGGGRPVMTVEHWDKPEEGVSVGTSSFDMNICSTVETDPGIKTLTHKTDQSLTFRSWWSAAGQPPPAASPKWSILPWRWRGGNTVRRRLSGGKTPFFSGLLPLLLRTVLTLNGLLSRRRGAQRPPFASISFFFFCVDPYTLALSLASCVSLCVSESKCLLLGQSRCVSSPRLRRGAKLIAPPPASLLYPSASSLLSPPPPLCSDACPPPAAPLCFCKQHML